MNLILSSLLKSVNLVTLDIRGNGFLRDDVICLIKLLETNKHLQELNGIPVVATSALKTSQVLFSVTNIPKLTKDMKSHSLDDTFWGTETVRSQVIEMAERDGFLFASLVTPRNFSRLKKLSISYHEFPDSALSFICDSIATAPSFDNLDLTNRGSNILLSVICTRTHLSMLNGLALHASADKGGVLPNCLWNDMTLGTLMRLKLWGALRGNPDDPMDISFHGITVTGLRGFAGKFKFDTQLSKNTFPIPFRKLDISQRHQVSDSVVADLSRSLSMPNLHPSLWRSDVRYSRRLRTRSAFALYYLLRPKIRPTKLPGSMKSQVVNGVDVNLLHEVAPVENKQKQAPREVAPVVLLDPPPLVVNGQRLGGD